MSWIFPMKLMNNLHRLDTRKPLNGKKWSYENREIMYTNATDG